MINFKDAYIMQEGGRRSDGVLKTIYRNVLDDERRKNANKVNEFLNSANSLGRVRAPLRPDQKRAARLHRK